MDWLIPSAVANLIGSLVLTFVYYYLYTQDRHRYLGIWAISWCIYAGRFILLLVSLQISTSIFITIAIQSATIISGLFLISGTYSFLDRPMPRWWLFGGALGTRVLPPLQAILMRRLLEKRSSTCSSGIILQIGKI